MSRGNYLKSGFRAYDRNFDINVGMAELESYLDVTIGRAACEA
jgi:hypothetical protein